MPTGSLGLNVMLPVWQPMVGLKVAAGNIHRKEQPRWQGFCFGIALGLDLNVFTEAEVINVAQQAIIT